MHIMLKYNFDVDISIRNFMIINNFFNFLLCKKSAKGLCNNMQSKMKKKCRMLSACLLYILYINILCLFTFFFSVCSCKTKVNGGSKAKLNNHMLGLHSFPLESNDSLLAKKNSTLINNFSYNSSGESKREMQDYDNDNQYIDNSALQNDNVTSTYYDNEKCKDLFSKLDKVCMKTRTEQQEFPCENHLMQDVYKEDNYFKKSSNKEICTREVSRREPYSCTKKEERRECREENVETTDVCERVVNVEVPDMCEKTVVQQICDNDVSNKNNANNACFEKAKQKQQYPCKKLSFQEVCLRKYSCENKVKKQKCQTKVHTYNTTCIEEVYDEEFTCEKLLTQNKCEESNSNSTTSEEYHVMAVHSSINLKEEKIIKNKIKSNNYIPNFNNEKAIFIKLPCKQLLKTVQSVCTQPSKIPRIKEYECEKTEEKLECIEVEEDTKDICFESIKKENIPKKSDKAQYVCNKVQLEEESLCSHEVEVAVVLPCGKSNNKKNCREIKKTIQEECIKTKQVTEKYECKKQKTMQVCNDLAPILRNEICYKIKHIVEQYPCNEKSSLSLNYGNNTINKNTCYKNIEVESEDPECIYKEREKLMKSCAAYFTANGGVVEQLPKKEEKKSLKISQKKK